MILYLLTITFCMLAIAVLTTVFSETTFFDAFGMTSLCTLLVIVIDALTATVARLLPKRFADHEKRVFAVGAREKNFYESIGIRKWKDNIPEIGHFTGFRKNKLAKPKESVYIRRFLVEICYGEIGHFYSLFTGFGTVFVFLNSSVWVGIALAVSFVNAILNALPIFVLRYNSYKLRILLKKTEKRREIA